MIDFALATKLFKNGVHRPQKKLRFFFGNSMFASEAMIDLMSTSRKCDLESLIYIICFLHKGSLPIVNIINEKHDMQDKKELLDHMNTYRRQHKTTLRDEVLSMLPDNLKSAFSYIHQLSFIEKPDYTLIKIFFAQT